MKTIISRQTLETEIEGSKAAIKAHAEGTEIHRIVLAAFETELKKLPKVEKKKISMTN